MNILLLGSGGREDALARRLSQSPSCTTLIAAPGNPGIARWAECHAIDPCDVDAVVALARPRPIDLVVVGPEAPLVAGVADALRAAGIATFGPSRRRRAARRQQGLHQGSVRPRRHPHRRLRPGRNRGRRPGRARRFLDPRRDQGRRPRRGQGRDRRHDPRRGRGRDPRRRRRADGDRGVPRGRGGQPVRAGRRPALRRARLGPGSQARRRRRYRPQHRRHGGLLPRPGPHPRARGPRDARDRRADRPRDGRGRHPVQRRAVRRADADPRRPQPDRI